jgi:hypothetical protein
MTIRRSFCLVPRQLVFDQNFQASFEYKKDEKLFHPKFSIESFSPLIQKETPQVFQNKNDNLKKILGVITILVIYNFSYKAIATSIFQLLKYEKNRSWKDWLASSTEYIDEVLDKVNPDNWEDKYFWVFAISANILGIGAHLLQDYSGVKYTLPSLERTPISLLIPNVLIESRHLPFPPKGFFPEIEYAEVIGRYLLPMLVRFIVEVGVGGESQPQCNVKTLLELLTDSNIMQSRLQEGLEKRNVLYYEPNKVEYDRVINKVSDLIQTGIPIILDYCKINPPVTKVRFNFTD